MGKIAKRSQTCSSKTENAPFDFFAGSQPDLKPLPYKPIYEETLTISSAKSERGMNATNAPHNLIGKVLSKKISFDPQNETQTVDSFCLSERPPKTVRSSQEKKPEEYIRSYIIGRQIFLFTGLLCKNFFNLIFFIAFWSVVRR